jgi:hypothetical protein
MYENKLPNHKLSAPLLFIVTYWVIAKALGLVLTKADILVPLLLFVTLGLLGINPIYKTLLFLVIFMMLRKFFPQFY